MPDKLPSGVTCPPPPPLAAWIKERGFDVCPWLPVPTDKVRPIPGQDAYRFGRLILARVPIPHDTDGELEEETRYYAGFQLKARPGQRYGKSLGYWFAVQGEPDIKSGKEP